MLTSNAWKRPDESSNCAPKTRREDLLRTETRGRELRDSIGQAEGRLDADLLAFAELKDQVRLADDRARELRAEFEHQETRIRDARRSLETVRGEAAGLEVVRATAETDLAHLATSCIDAVQATLDEVAAEVDQLEREGAACEPRCRRGHPGSGGNGRRRTSSRPNRSRPRARAR